MKELFGLISVALALISCVPYYRDIFKKITKPHLYTYLIWTITSFIAFFGQLAANGGPGAWQAGVMGLTLLGVFVLSFKYGTDDVKRLDLVFLVGALLALVPWWLTKDPTISVVLATFIDACAYGPTLRKTFNDPSTETLSAWIMSVLRPIFSIFALTSYSIATVVFPAALLLMNAAVVGVIVLRRRTKV